MTTNISPIAAALLSNAEVETLVGEIADYRLTLGGMSEEQDASLRALNAEIKRLRQVEEAAMERQSENMRTIRLALDVRVAVLRAWAEANKGEHFSGKKRSLKLLHGTVGFRQSKPRVEPLPRRSLARAAAWLARLVWGRRYVRFTAPALNLQAILDDRVKLEARPTRLKQMGVRIVQDDEFYVTCERTRSDLLTAEAKHREAA